MVDFSELYGSKYAEVPVRFFRLQKSFLKILGLQETPAHILSANR